jgi:hypothetical protein
MTNEIELENNSAIDREVHSALKHFSEIKRLRLFKSIEALRHEFRLGYLFSDESIEAVATAEAFLKVWSDELNLTFAERRARTVTAGYATGITPVTLPTTVARSAH